MTHETYPDAPASLIARWDARRAPMPAAPGEGLPPPDCDLAALLAVPADAEGEAPPATTRQARKALALHREFAGKPALFALHALTIAHLRKRAFPDHAPALFRRMWTEQRQPLLDGLPNRWLVSAAITFADHGETEGERRLAAELNVLFALLKLYEYERLFAGKAPADAFTLRRRAATELPMGLESFSLVSGGLDVNLLAPIWQRAQAEPVLGPIALRLLERLNADPGTVFARLAAMRAAKVAATAAKRNKT